MGKRGTLIIVETSIEFNGSKCQTYAHADGSYYSRGGGKIMARRHLTKADRPPKSGEVCRHKCKNDSTAPNGFVCCNSDHTQWGTYSENNGIDKTPEARARGGKAVAASGQLDRIRTAASCSKGGKIGGKIAVESGQLARIRTAASLSKGGKIGGKHPNAAANRKVTCDHCKKTISLLVHARLHGDRCKDKDKLISALLIDDTDNALDLIYSRTEAV